MQPDPDLWLWGEGSGCTKMNMPPLKKKKTNKNLNQKHWGHRNGGGGGIITGSDEGEKEHYWQWCPLWARQRRIHKDRAAMKEGQSERKRHQATTWKHSEVDTFTFSAFLHLQIFHVLRRLCPRHIWSILVFFLLLKKFVVRGKHLCFALIT